MFILFKSNLFNINKSELNMFPSFNFPNLPMTSNNFSWNFTEPQLEEREEFNLEPENSPKEEEGENSLFKIIENWGKQLKVSVERDQLTVQHFKNFISLEQKLSQSEIDKVRIIFNGKALDDLEEKLSPLFAEVENPTIHVIITPERKRTESKSKKRKIEEKGTESKKRKIKD